MKSKFFGFNAKLALMLVAMCGIFASCYQKEEIDVPDPEEPSTVTPVYKIQGIVTDEKTGEALQSAKVNGQGVNTDGSYNIDVDAVNAGKLFILTFTAYNHVTVKTSVYIDKKENGTVTVYNVNAALKQGEGTIEEVTYKTPRYEVNGNVTDMNGNAINLKSVYVFGVTDLKYSQSNFTFSTLTIGTYEAYIEADGYLPAAATIYVSAVAPEKGEPTEYQSVPVKVSVIMQPKPEDPQEPEIIDPVYYVQGNLYNENGIGINNVDVVMSTKSGYNASEKTTNGFFYFTVESKYVQTMTVGTIKCVQANYKPYACSFLLAPVAGNATSAVTSTVTLMGTLKTANDSGEVPDEDFDQGGSGQIEIPVEDAEPEVVDKKGEEATKEEIETAVDNLMDKVMTPEEKEKAEVKPEEVATIIDEMKQDGTIQNVENIVAVKVETAKTIDIASTVSVGEGSTSTTKEEVDQITIPAGVIIYATGVAENITMTRDPKTEKATAGTRVYEGNPTGTIFTTPLEIQFDSPVAITEKPDFDLNILYYNENTKTWKKGDTKAVFENGKFAGKVKHFSKFKFGFDSKYGVDDAKVDSVVITDEPINKACYTGAAAQPVVVKVNYDGGIKYAPYSESSTTSLPTLAVKEQLSKCNEATSIFVGDMMSKLLKANNLNVTPTPNYTKQTASVEMVIPAYAQVESFQISRTQVTYTATIYVTLANGSEIPVKVKVSKIISVTVKPIYTIGHGHGHGHGDDLNAGGGIIEVE